MRGGGAGDENRESSYCCQTLKFDLLLLYIYCSYRSLEPFAKSESFEEADELTV